MTCVSLVIVLHGFHCDMFADCSRFAHVGLILRDILSCQNCWVIQKKSSSPLENTKAIFSCQIIICLSFTTGKWQKIRCLCYFISRLCWLLWCVWGWLHNTFFHITQPFNFLVLLWKKSIHILILRCPENRESESCPKWWWRRRQGIGWGFHQSRQPSKRN